MHYEYRKIKGTWKNCCKWWVNVNCGNVNAGFYCIIICIGGTCNYVNKIMFWIMCTLLEENERLSRHNHSQKHLYFKYENSKFLRQFQWLSYNISINTSTK
jgi:hypothetical protein